MKLGRKGPDIIACNQGLTLEKMMRTAVLYSEVVEVEQSVDI